MAQPLEDGLRIGRLQGLPEVERELRPEPEAVLLPAPVEERLVYLVRKHVPEEAVDASSSRGHAFSTITTVSM